MERRIEQLEPQKEVQETSEMEAEKEAYRKIMQLPENKYPDLILALDAGIAERKVFGESQFNPTSYEDETGNFSEEAVADSAKYNLRKTSRGNLLVGAGGGKARLLAVRNLLKVFNSDIVTDSRFPVGASDHPEFPEGHSAIYKRFLEKAGIPSEKITEEKESTTTFEGLINFLMIATEADKKSLVIVTNDYHLLRTKKILELLMDKEKAQKLKYVFARMPKEYQEKIGAKIKNREDGEVDLFFDDDSFFKKIKDISVSVASAEEILAYNNPHYKNLFKKVEKTAAYKKRVTLEQKGIDQLESGVYGKARKE